MNDMDILKRLNKKTEQLNNPKGNPLDKSNDKILRQIYQDKMANFFQQVEELQKAKIKVLTGPGWGSKELVKSLEEVLGSFSSSRWQYGAPIDPIYGNLIRLNGPIYTYLKLNPYNAGVTEYFFDPKKDEYVICENINNGTFQFSYFPEDGFLIDHLLTQISKRKVNQTLDGKIWSQHPGLQCDGSYENHLEGAKPSKFYYHGTIVPNLVWLCEVCSSVKEN